MTGRVTRDSGFAEAHAATGLFNSWSDSLKRQNVIEAECAFPECLCHVVDAVFAHDVECKASGTGYDSWVISDPALVLVEGHVANMMVAVLNAPMRPDGGGPNSCWEIFGGRDVEGDLPALSPQARHGRTQQGAPGDADDGLDATMPLGCGQGIACGKDFDGAILCARPPLSRDITLSTVAVLSVTMPTASNSLGWFAFTWTRTSLPVWRATSNVFLTVQGVQGE
jgi:hypothetical protein